MSQSITLSVKELWQRALVFPVWASWLPGWSWKDLSLRPSPADLCLQEK